MAKKSYKDFYPAANNGDPEAQHEIGLAFSKGEGTRKNAKKALVWFRKSARQGYPPAQFSIGKAYELGEGVREDKKKAFGWYAQVHEPRSER